MFINYILSQRFLLNFNVTPLLAHYHTKHFKDVLLRHSDQKSFIVLLESRFFFVFGYLGVWGNLRRQQKTLIFFCAFGGLGVWGNFFWVNFRRHPICYSSFSIFYTYLFHQECPGKMKLFFAWFYPMVLFPSINSRVDHSETLQRVSSEAAEMTCTVLQKDESCSALRMVCACHPRIH